MRLAFAALAVLLAPVEAGAQLPGEVVCPKAKQDEIAAMNLAYQKQGALAQIMAVQCDAQGNIAVLTLVRLRDGQLMQWRPAEGQPVLARKLLSGE